MPKLFRKNLSFQAGEISPRFFGRSDTDFYLNGLATAKNVFIDKRGGAFRRPGFEHRLQVPGNYGRVFTNQINVNRFDTILLTDELLTVFAPGAGFIGANLLLNPNFFDQGDNWTVIKQPISSVVAFSTGSCALIPETVEPQLVVNPSFDAGATGWTERVTNQSTVNFASGQCVLTPRGAGGTPTDYAGIFQEMTTDNVGELHTLKVTGAANTELEIKVGTVEDDGTYFEDIITLAGEGISTFTPLASPFTVTINCYNPNINVVLDSVEVIDETPQFSSVSQEATVVGLITAIHDVIVYQTEGDSLVVNIGTTQGGDDIDSFSGSNEILRFSFVPNNATYWVTVRANGKSTPSATVTFIGTAEETQVDTGGQEMVAPWTEEQLPFVHVVQNPTGEALYFTHPNVAPQKLAYSFATDVYATLVPVPFTAPPAEWTGDNWPATGTYFQGRLWLGGTPGQPQTFWGSVSGSPEDFTVTASQDDSSLQFAMQEFGRIKWMLGTKNLLIGTENGEHLITSNGPIITPTDFKIERQSSYGSNNMQALQVAEKVFYTTPDGLRVRAMGYEWQEDNWLSEDLNFHSDHITASGARQNAWLQNPNALYYMVLDNGTVVVLTYDRTGNTAAWCTLEIEGMHVFDVAVGTVDGKSRTVTLGQRTSATRTPGMLDIGLNTSFEQYLDQSSHVSDAAGTNIIDGLDHLEGEIVQILVDGAVDPSKVVIGGQVTTDRTGVELYAGIQIKSKITTLPPDVPQDQIRSWKKRWNKVWALMYDSKQPIINGVRPPDRTPSTPMDTVEPNISGHYKTVNLGWDDFGQITIEEDLPVSMNVLAIYGEMGVETLK